jgi:LPPG:FO 2-phospho-L-lactate transferase
VIVGLGGGIGAARFWRALLARVDAAELTLVVNTADDLWIHGLRVCPDLDTIAYALSGRQDTERGWGVRDESFRTMGALRALGHEPWFNLGDLDLATHLFRTGRLRDGWTLAEVTTALGAAMGVGPRLLPMTDDEVETHVLTGGWMHYQDFFVRCGAAEEVRAVDYRGIGTARPAPGVTEALAAADLVVLAPSNPLASIGPILAVPGVREALAACAAPVVAITPIVSGVAITDPGEGRRAGSRAALLRSAGLAHTASAAASLLRGIADVFVLDRADADERDSIAGAGLQVVLADTLVGRPGHACGDDGVAEVVDQVLALRAQPSLKPGNRISPRNLSESS